jgi:hypothetical protein
MRGKPDITLTAHRHRRQGAPWFIIFLFGFRDLTSGIILVCIIFTNMRVVPMKAKGTGHDQLFN